MDYIDAKGARRLTLKMTGMGMAPMVREYLIPKHLRYVAMSIEGRPMGSPTRDGPWERLPPAEPVPE